MSTDLSWRLPFTLLAILLAAVFVRAEEPQDARITNAGLEIHYRALGTGALAPAAYPVTAVAGFIGGVAVGTWFAR